MNRRTGRLRRCPPSIQLRQLLELNSSWIWFSPCCRMRRNRAGQPIWKTRSWTRPIVLAAQNPACHTVWPQWLSCLICMRWIWRLRPFWISQTEQEREFFSWGQNFRIWEHGQEFCRVWEKTDDCHTFSNTNSRLSDLTSTRIESQKSHHHNRLSDSFHHGRRLVVEQSAFTCLGYNGRRFVRGWFNFGCF